MEHSLALMILGIVSVLIGLVLAYNPELVSKKPIPESIFKAVERRIKWGLVIGVGILLIFHQQLLPWTLTLAGAGFALTLGILIARLIGIVVDGSVIKQWYWVGVELVFLVIFGIWYAKQIAL